MVVSVAMFVLAGCGGGGSGRSGPTASNLSFPFAAGYGARIAAGATDNYSISGSCAGSATMTNGAASASTFEGVTGFAAAQTLTQSLTNCTAATNAVSGTTYWDSTFAPLGYSIPGVEYAKFLTAPPPLPASVRVGDTGVDATLTRYTDSTKTVTTGQSVLSYVIEADSADTAVVNLISMDYNTSNQLLFTQQTRMQISANGTLSAVSIDVQASTTSTIHLVYTKA